MTKVLSKRDTEFRATVMSPRQNSQHNEDERLHLRQDREQTAGTCEQKPYIKDVRIKSEPNLEPFCEDLWEVLDELGEILAEEQAVSEFEMKPVITPPPPSISLADDTSLFTRRFKSINDPFPVNFAESSEIESKADIDIGNTRINKHNKPKGNPVNVGHKSKPRVRRSSTKDATEIHVNRAIASYPESPRPTSKELFAHKKSTTRRSTSGDLRLRSKSRRSDTARQRHSRSQSNRRSSSVRSGGCRRSTSHNSKYCTADQKRHRSKSSDPIRIRSRRISSPRDRRRQTYRCRSRSPGNMRLKRSWAERIQRHRNSTSLSPKRSHDLSRIHVTQYSPLRLHRRRSRSRPNPGKISRRRRSRSRSIRSKFPDRSRQNPEKSLIRDRSGSMSKSRKILHRRRSGSRSMSSTVPLRERSRSISRPSNALKGTRPGSRPPKLIIRQSSRRKSPSAQSQRLLDETMTPVPVDHSYHSSQTSQSVEQMLQPIKSASPVVISPRPIASMITLHDNRVSRPYSLRDQLLPTPLAPHMFGMQTHFTSFEYTSVLSCQASGPPFNPPPVDLGPFDLRRRLNTSRSLYSLGPNDLRHRIQDLYCQNTYLPPPAFSVQAPWPSGYPIDYNPSGYF